MICKYQHKGSWEESLSIFLFSKLINNDEDPNTLEIESYNSFELKDITIKSYNQWFDSDKNGLNIIELWLTKNSDIVKNQNIPINGY